MNAASSSPAPPALIAARLAPMPAPQRLAVLALTFAALVFAGMQLGLMALVSLSISQDLLGKNYNSGAGGDWFGRYTAAIMLGAALGGVCLGALGDRVGRARALGVSVIVYSVCGGAGAIVFRPGQLLVLRFLAGIGVGGAWPNGVALASECWDGISRTTAAAIMGAAINVGIFCVAELGQWRPITADSWRWLVACGGLPVLLGLISLGFLPESPKWKPPAAGRRGEAGGVSPIVELFAPAMRGRTLIGISLGTIPLVGAWAASKWMIPWADQIGGTAHPGYKAVTQSCWATGAILGSFLGAFLATFLGRRTVYFVVSLASVTLTCGIFKWLRPLGPAFLPAVFVQGLVTTLYFGWLPLYLPELFPTRVRVAGTGIAYNAGRIIAAVGVLCAGSLVAWSGGDYSRVGVILGLVYALGMIVIWWAPDTSRTSLDG